VAALTQDGKPRREKSSGTRLPLSDKPGHAGPIPASRRECAARRKRGSQSGGHNGRFAYVVLGLVRHAPADVVVVAIAGPMVLLSGVFQRFFSGSLVSPALSSCLKCDMLWHATNWTSEAGVGVE